MTTLEQKQLPWYFLPLLVLISGCIVAIINFGVRSTFGLFTLPDQADSMKRARFRARAMTLMPAWGMTAPHGLDR